MLQENGDFEALIIGKVTLGYFIFIRNLPTIYILIQWEACPVEEVQIEGWQPAGRHANTRVQDELGEQGVQLIVLHQGLLLEKNKIKMN